MNELTVSTLKPTPCLPGTLSDEALQRAIHGSCDQDRTLREIRDLMRAYWQPNEPAEERVRYETLIVKDLAQFSDWAIASAVKEWRRTMTRRPTPADLIAACARYRQNAVVHLSGKNDDRVPGPTVTHAGHSSKVDEAARIGFRRIAKEAGFVERGGDWITQAHRDELNSSADQRPHHWTEREETRTRWHDALNAARSGNPLMRPSDE